MQWPRLDELNDATVTAAYEYVVQLIRERHPDIDAQRGMLGTLISELHAILHGAMRTVIQNVHNSLSVKAVLEHPSRTKQELVDKLLANVGMSRSYVEKATGRVRYVLHRPIYVSIVRGETLFDASGQVFLADASATFKEPDVPLRNYDEFHLHKLDDKYVCSFPVTSQNSNCVPPRRETPFTPHIAPPGLAEAYAEADFRGSFMLQDDVDAIRCLRLGHTAQGFSGRRNIEALIWKADPAKYRFAADVKDIKIVGANDPGGEIGKIRIVVTCRDGVDTVGLVKELDEYLHDPDIAHPSALVTVEAAQNA